MRPRQSILESFSTFLQFEAERWSGWVMDRRLLRSMQNCLAQRSPPADSEQFWVLYWYKVWDVQPLGLARTHLSAYLQEACYWAAQKASVNLTTSQYGLSDYFQIAIARVDKVLKGFNPQQGFSLKNYASVTFGSVIKDLLRQRQAVDLCTHWALLRKLSQKRLIEALQNEGLAVATIECYVLAWRCFKSLYVPTQATATSKLSKPDAATWEAIAQLYNQERHGHLAAPGPRESPEVLEKWLVNSAKAARLYLYPPAVSLNTPKPGWDSGELQDHLVGGDSPFTTLLVQEQDRARQTQQTQVQEVLVAALSHLDPQVQQILGLYYREDQTQQQIAQQLDIKQYTVSRRLTKAREQLLLALAQWSQDSLHTSLNSNVLKQMSAVLEEWLANYYAPSSYASATE